MPGNYRTLQLADGRFADVPEDQLDEFMSDLDQAGVQFKDANVTADMQYGAPEVIKQEGALDRQPSMGDRFLSSLGNMGEAATRGFNKSATWGANDQLGAGMNALTGGDFKQDLQNSRARDAFLQEDSPISYGVGRAVGFLPSVATGPMSWGARALMSGAQGAGEAALASEEDVLPNAGKGFLKGAAASLGGDALGAGLSKLGGGLRNVGVATRRASATGASPADLGTIRDERGIDFMENGLDQRFRELGLADSMKPQSAGDVYRKINPEAGPGLLRSAGQREGAALDAAGEQGIRGDLTSVNQGINGAMGRRRGQAEVASDQTSAELGATRAIQDRLPIAPPSAYGRPLNEPPPLPINANNLPMKKMGKPPSQKYADWMDAHEAETFADDVPFPADPDVPPPGFNPNLRTPRELHTQKKEFDAAGYSQDLAPQSEKTSAAANRNVASGYRNELDDAMRQSGPENYQNFNEGRQDYRDLSLLGELSGKRADQNAGAAAFKNPFMYGGATAGAALGGTLGAVAGPAGSVLGAGAGMAAGGKLGQKYGQDIAGMGMMGVGMGMQGAGGMASAGAKVAGPAAAYSSEDNDRSRGYLLSEAALDALQNEPQSLQGYASVFSAAAASPEPSAVSSLITKLSRTDPNFRKNVLPALRARTQGDL